MKLYEIDDAMAALIDPDTGELKDYEAFAALNMERERKIEGMVAWYKDMCGDAEKIKDGLIVINGQSYGGITAD